MKHSGAIWCSIPTSRRFAVMWKAGYFTFCSLKDGEDASNVGKDKPKRWFFQKEEEKEKYRKENTEKRKKKKDEGFLPHWCIYIAWTLCMVSSITSAVYTLFYSMVWGKEKSNQWIVSMIFMFSQDTLINQPAKVILLSAGYAIFIRKSDEESEATQTTEDPRKGKTWAGSLCYVTETCKAGSVFAVLSSFDRFSLV